MTFDKNDLVERLRHTFEDEAADRIEELEASLAEQIEWVKRLADDLNAAEGREARLKAKLAKSLGERDEALNQLFIAAEVAEGAGAGAILYLRLLQLRVAELRGQDDE
jgi:uncharacterized coiled-coil protein SlyX